MLNKPSVDHFVLLDDMESESALLLSDFATPCSFDADQLADVDQSLQVLWDQGLYTFFYIPYEFGVALLNQASAPASAQPVSYTHLEFVKVKLDLINGQRGNVMRSANYFFKEDELIDQQYKGKSLISINDYAQTYRVRNPAFEAKVLKLFLKEANTELSVLERLDSPHVVKLDSVGQVRVNGSDYPYAILDYVNGDSLFERTERQEMLSFIGAYNVFLRCV